MAEIGYTLSSEEFGPRELVRFAERAEAAGFDFVSVSDHFHPWIDQQGHSPFVWATLGGVAQATERVTVATGVTCPTTRVHPAIVAHAAATVASMMPGRFVLGLGAGENLNEHVVGGWPHVQQRHEMFEEALQIIRPLLNGETLTFSGNHFDVPEAYLWDRPDQPVGMAVAASGPSSAALAAEYADGIVATEPDRRIIQLYDDAECRKLVHDQFRWFGMGWKVNADLPGPEAFAAATQYVREEDVAEGIPCGPDVDRHVEAFKQFVDAGFTHVAIVQVGGETQPMFLDWAQEELLPRLREL
jgi:hypothetical protein